MTLPTFERHSTAQPLVSGRNVWPFKYRRNDDLYPGVNVLTITRCKRIGNVKPGRHVSLTLLDYVDLTEELDVIESQFHRSPKHHCVAEISTIFAPNREVQSAPRAYEARGDRAISGVLDLATGIPFVGVAHPYYPGWVALDPEALGGKEDIFTIAALRDVLKIAA